ncbi:hypothetical protein BGZ81_007389 [Podila clonocystis]|nr:hypothetical protein BGZ81_007389 [Podila clonocystis]
MPEYNLIVFEQPWNCPHLKGFEQRFMSYDIDSLRQRLSRVLFERLDREEKHGRAVYREEFSGALISGDSDDESESGQIDNQMGSEDSDGRSKIGHIGAKEEPQR